MNGSVKISGGKHLVALNAAQREAVTTLSGPLLVLAGAGTGKTRVITYRMAELIRDGVRADRILSVTFTNKAAKEMQERIVQLLGKRVSPKPIVSTFHSLCVKILRAEIDALGYPKNFVIYDRGDQEAAARKALRDIRLDSAALRPGDLLFRISRWKTAGLGPEEARDDIEDDRDFLAAAGYRRYQAHLRSAGAVDFDDLLRLTAQLFHEAPESLERQQARFDSVQIDEYQDTNELQFRLVRSLVEPHKNLCVVGDDDQSIYGWRGAEVKHILNFQRQFPQAKVIRLQENYRCTREIISAANCLISRNRDRHDKHLIASKDLPSSVSFREFGDEEMEAEGVVRDINYAVKQLSIQPREFAILFRTNEQPRLFETELRRHQLPYKLVGGQSFYDRKEVRDLLAYLKAIANPKDEMSLRRIINVPARGIGETTVEKIAAHSVQERVPFWEAAQHLLTKKELPPKAAASLDRFSELMEQFRATFGNVRAGAGLADAARAMVNAIDYASEVRHQYPSIDMQQVRLNAVEEFISTLGEYQQQAARPSLSEFLDQTTLEGREYGADGDDWLAENAVKLITLHSAKGLEFSRVYLVGLEEGLLPHQRSLDIGSREAIEEERRLAYVGVTRAKDYLTITRSKTRTKYGKAKLMQPSRFLAEMQNPEDA